MLADIAAGIQKTLDRKPFDGTLKFDCGADGVIVLAEGRALTEDRPTDCTLTLSRENLVKLLKGQLNPMTAMVMGKLKFSGDMGVALKLAKLIG